MLPKFFNTFHVKRDGMPNLSLFVNFPQLFVYFTPKSGPVLKLTVYGHFRVWKRGAKFIDAIQPTHFLIYCDRVYSYSYFVEYYY